MTSFKRYYESTMRFNFFLYTIKEKLQSFPLSLCFWRQMSSAKSSIMLFLIKTVCFLILQFWSWKQYIYLVHQTCLRCLLLIIGAETIRIF